MCNASNFSVGVRRNRIFHPIYYASQTLMGAQVNYMITEKELLPIIFAFDKYQNDFVFYGPFGYQIFTSQERCQVDIDPRVLLLQELEQQEGTSSHVPIKEIFLDEHILKVNHVYNTYWFADFANYLACGLMSLDKAYQ
ncbi:Retrovirus-related Pol polyprotein from transposon 17.6 [Gossypium australe]|uniref:Retrovirus-related Pol polyprotein from transposon 17.6 n=1 Tax=Gossypium australe TaxID=47621 RepID=A0A5B6WQJ3_9ROSI|nr:Retrovirus-related Pol polyprotein from transposon 17.6 [Gossypium australe]